MAALKIIGRFPANPLDLRAGALCASAILRGEHKVGDDTLVELLAALDGRVKPEDVMRMAYQKDLLSALVTYLAKLMLSWGPEKMEEAQAPKS